MSETSQNKTKKKQMESLDVSKQEWVSQDQGRERPEKEGEES